MRNTIRMSNGVVHALDTENLDSYISNHENSGGNVTEVCLKLISPGQCFYDIGANVGIVSLAVSQGTSDRVKVFAFEPQTQIAHQIALSASLNNFANVSVYDVDVTDITGEINLFVPNASTHASIVSLKNVIKKIKVRTICLDEYVNKGILPTPNVVKIDVEGAEQLVLSGMKSIISKTSPAIVFEADSNMERFGTKHSDIFNFLLSLTAYDFYLLLPDPKNPNFLVPVANTNKESGNFLAISKNNSDLKSRLNVVAPI